MNYKDRLLLEFKEIVERRIIVQRTIEDCSNIDSKQVELLRKQLEYMMGYEEILFIRIIDEIERR